MKEQHGMFVRLDDKIATAEKALASRIDERIKRSDLEHYATKHDVLSTFFKLLATFIGLLVLICTSYVFVTPLIIDSKISKFEHKLDAVLMLLKPTTDNKTK